jgi:hypothetical protein
MRIPDEVLECVVFLGAKDIDGRVRQLGTGFLFGREIGIGDLEARYLATAKHVIEGILSISADATVYVRFNRSDGTSQVIPAAASAWMFDEDPNVDIAVATVSLDQPMFQSRIVPESLIATDDIIVSEEIGIGDDVFLTGLFVNHFGDKRNVPILRTGTISAMPGEPILVNTMGGLTYIDAYLVEARSIGGLSGSPVFVRTDGMRGNTFIPGLRFWLLGIMRGHWDTKFQVEDAVVPNHLVGEAVNMGMSIVVPASKLIDITNHPTLLELRKQQAEYQRQQKAEAPE